jgi:hypothetical protein
MGAKEVAQTYLCGLKPNPRLKLATVAFALSPHSHFLLAKQAMSFGHSALNSGIYNRVAGGAVWKIGRLELTKVALRKSIRLEDGEFRQKGPIVLRHVERSVSKRLPLITPNVKSPQVL